MEKEPYSERRMANPPSLLVDQDRKEIAVDEGREGGRQYPFPPGDHLRNRQLRESPHRGCQSLDDSAQLANREPQCSGNPSLEETAANRSGSSRNIYDGTSRRPAIRRRSRVELASESVGSGRAVPRRPRGQA